MCTRADVLRLGRLPLPLELAPGAREAGGEGVGNVVIARDREHVRPEALEEGGGALVLVAPAAVRQVTARDHELRPDALDQRSESRSSNRDSLR